MTKKKKDKFAENPLIESMRHDDAVRLLDSLGLGEPPKEAPKKADFALKILAVEDDESSRELYVQYFVEKKCLVIPASTGAEAINLISEHPDIKVIILDLKMPPPDGISIIKTIRKQKILEGVPIIVASGHLTPETVKSCMDMGVAKIYSKPVDMDNMFEVIKLSTPYEKLAKEKNLL